MQAQAQAQMQAQAQAQMQAQAQAQMQAQAQAQLAQAITMNPALVAQLQAGNPAFKLGNML
jgi:hypothetical protein